MESRAMAPFLSVHIPKEGLSASYHRCQDSHTVPSPPEALCLLPVQRIQEFHNLSLWGSWKLHQQNPWQVFSIHSAVVSVQIQVAWSFAKGTDNLPHERAASLCLGRHIRRPNR